VGVRDRRISGGHDEVVTGEGEKSPMPRAVGGRVMGLLTCASWLVQIGPKGLNVPAMESWE
jgi:hypothetical protein